MGCRRVWSGIGRDGACCGLAGRSGTSQIDNGSRIDDFCHRRHAVRNFIQLRDVDWCKSPVWCRRRGISTLLLRICGRLHAIRKSRAGHGACDGGLVPCTDCWSPIGQLGWRDFRLESYFRGCQCFRYGCLVFCDSFARDKCFEYSIQCERFSPKRCLDCLAKQGT